MIIILFYESSPSFYTVCRYPADSLSLRLQTAVCADSRSLLKIQFRCLECFLNMYIFKL